MSNMVSPRVFAEALKSAGQDKAEGVRRVVEVVREGIALNRKNKNEGFAPDQVSFKDLGLALGVLDPYAPNMGIGKALAEFRNTDPDKFNAESIYQESNPGLMSNAFQVLTNELLAPMVIEGYESGQGYIGDELVTTLSSPNRRNLKIPGITPPGGPMEVAEGHPYPETDMDEKYVTTLETKKGRILSISEETLMFDQTALIRMKANDLGTMVRQEREITILRGVMDADAGAGKYVYRPSGTGEALYNVDGSNYNYIGAGNTTSASFAAAVPLVDWTDLNEILKYRALEIKDDRIDGTRQPIQGLIGPQNVLLVPWSLYAQASYIKNQTMGVKHTNSAVDETHFNNNPVAGFVGRVLSSPLMDSVSPADYFYGDFKKQFVWVEQYPVQTFTQGAGSEANFERDVALRIKVRYYGGLAARDSIYVTKIDGA